MKKLIMKYWNDLRKTNHKLAKTEEGRKLIMKEAMLMGKMSYYMQNAISNAIKLHNSTSIQLK